MEINNPSDAVKYIKNELRPILRSEKNIQKTCRRLARFEVALIVYDRTFSKEPYHKAPVRSNRKNPTRNDLKVKRDEERHAPVTICTKRKMEVYKDDANSCASCSSHVSNLHSAFMTPIDASAHCARKNKSRARRAIKKSLVEEDRASERRVPESPEEPPCFTPENNINCVYGDGPDNMPESVRLQQFDSRPNSPIDAEINRIFYFSDPAQPSVASDEDILEQGIF